MKHLFILLSMTASLWTVNNARANEAGDPVLGATQWANNCARCHNMRDPSEFEAKAWRPIVTHMRLRAGLNGKEARNILAFLQGSAADANQTFRVTPVSQNPRPGTTEALSGESVYQTTCIACHGADGAGILPGTPNFTSAKSPLATKTQDELLRNMLNGFQSKGSPMAMPAKGGNPVLGEQDMRNVLDYMLENFAN